MTLVKTRSLNTIKVERGKNFQLVKTSAGHLDKLNSKIKLLNRTAYSEINTVKLDADINWRIQ